MKKRLERIDEFLRHERSLKRRAKKLNEEYQDLNLFIMVSSRIKKNSIKKEWQKGIN